MVGTCDHALVSDVGFARAAEPPSGATLYYSHPGAANDTNLPRANYTLHTSTDSGASFQFVDRIYAGGAGYSDAHVIPGPNGSLVLGMAFQRTFDPPNPSIEGGGYNIGFATIPI